jgi:S-DNA-T family DNA segregation ATPase FtsK/SpoIIIE
MDEKKIKRAREIYGMLFLALSVFLLLCLISYHPDDPSFNRYVTVASPPHNLIGSFGAHTADILIRLIGLGAFFLPLFFFILSCKYFKQNAFSLSTAVALSFAAFLFSTAGIFTLILKELDIYDARLQAGGILGDILIKFLNDYFNYTGAYLLLLLITVISLMIMIDLSIIEIASKAVDRLFSALSGLKKQIARVGKILAKKHGKKKTTPLIDEPPQKESKSLKEAEQTRFDFLGAEHAFKLPPLTLLDQVDRKDAKIKRESLVANARILEKKLFDFGVEGKVMEIKPGPVITMYELEPAPGVKINKITNLSDDLALALKAPSIRIIAPVPGKAVVGIEIPNQEREPVYLKDVLDNETFRAATLRLPIALGVDIMGTPVVTDLISMPHLLIAGTTGSGKSVFLNAMICSILFKAPPDEVKFLMIDPKRLELSYYEGIPHLLHPVVLDPKMSAQVLKWAVEEMERRYQIISTLGVKNIESYNELLKKANGNGGKLSTAELVTRKNGKAADHFLEDENVSLPGKLPYIVIIIDELADLMVVAQRNVEESLARLAQMARAAGIHLILATQRPSVDVITGVIKANFPTRISFQVSSKVDSRTILDQHGAEKLLGAGDMLFIPPGTSRLTRIHGAYVSDKEIERISDFVTQQAKPSYDESISKYEVLSPEGEKADDEFDEKYDTAVELVTDLGHASVSLVQRYLKIGYNRAARIIERMEAEGVVGPSDGVKPRKVLARKAPH